MNVKLIRNAMFVTVVIVTISLMGKASAHESAAPFVTSTSAMAWMTAVVR